MSAGEAYPDLVEIVPGGPVRGSIRPPGSKSLTNRALLAAAMAAGQSHLCGVLQSEDTEVMITALRQVGVGINISTSGRSIEVTGVMGVEPAAVGSQGAMELFVGNSGTTVRFLTAALSALGGSYRLYGVPRMHQRPISGLVDALAPIVQGTVECESPGGCPPVLIHTSGWDSGQLRVAGEISSQYLSGLMLALPVAGLEGRIEVVGELVSRPYVEMTAKLIGDFGVPCELLDQPQRATGLVCHIDGRQGYQAIDYSIEPDASAASYFWAAAAITGGDVTVSGLSTDALQGDVGFVDVLQRMGCAVHRGYDQIRVVGGRSLRGIDVDMNAISDTVQTLSVVALFAEGTTRIRGVAHNRYKETDRISDLACQLRKLGAEVEETADGLVITPPAQVVAATLDTYNDHRMAMSLALAGLRVAGVRIRNPSCSAKTYPDFFADLESLIGRSHRWGTR